MFVKKLLPVLLLATTFTVSAQSGSAAKTTAQPQPTAAQQAQEAQMKQKMAQSAVGIVQMIDANKVGEVWDGASSVAKQAAARDAFIKQISTDRATLGKPMSRGVGNVNFTRSDGSNKNLPAGIYSNVAFSTKFANNKEAVRELVSFHLDNDKVWRVAGYTVH